MHSCFPAANLLAETPCSASRLIPGLDNRRKRWNLVLCGVFPTAKRDRKWLRYLRSFWSALPQGDRTTLYGRSVPARVRALNPKKHRWCRFARRPTLLLSDGKMQSRSFGQPSSRDRATPVHWRQSGGLPPRFLPKASVALRRIRHSRSASHQFA